MKLGTAVPAHESDRHGFEPWLSNVSAVCLSVPHLSFLTFHICKLGPWLLTERVWAELTATTLWNTFSIVVYK